MRIGHYSPWLSSPGGVQTYLRRIVEGQTALGHEIILFNRPDLVSCERTSAFGAEIVPTQNDAELLKSAESRGLDVLHVHTAVELPPQDAGSGPGPAQVRTMHGHEAYCPSGTRHLARPASRPCPRACHFASCTWGHFINRCGSVRPREFVENFRRVRRERRSAKHFFTIAISHFAKAQMVRAGYDESTISVILHPAPACQSMNEVRAIISDQSNPPVFLFLGRIVPGKGLDWLIRAVARLDERTPARFEIIGDGSHKERLMRLSEDLGIAHRLAWLGWLEEPAILARMTKARAVIFPSLWHEPAGLVTLEAAASGCAVIASRVGGIPEYAEKLGNVVLVDPNDADALAAAIAQLADDAELAGNLGQTGRQRVIKGALSLERHLDELDAIYAQMTQCH